MNKIVVNEGDVLANVTGGIIVHGCNSRGVMGSGIALSIKNKYPDAFGAYRSQYEKSGLTLGDVIFVEVMPGLFVANAITQAGFIGTDGSDPYGRYVSYDALDIAFKRVNEFSKKHSLPVHYPLIGADRGRGDWAIISTIIQQSLSDTSYLWILPSGA